jgi:hypothetical protein
MRRRTLLVVLAGLAAVVAAGVVVLWPQSAARITREDFGLIKPGMAKVEVEAILGPAGDHRTGDTRPDASDNTSPRILGTPAEGISFWEWRSDTTFLLLGFDTEGRLTGGHHIPTQRVTDNPFVNLWWRAKGQCQKWLPGNPTASPLAPAR